MRHKRICALFLALALFCPAAGIALEEEKPIKWVDFTVPSGLMKEAIRLDMESREAGVRLHWIEMLAYLAAKNGGNFQKTKSKDLGKLAESLRGGTGMAELTEKMTSFGYYSRAYAAVLGGLMGEYETGTELPDGSVAWEPQYGLRAYAPIAKGYDFSHFDDFGSGRDYGYKRRHLGHDMMALTGTPVIAAESGVVEELGWNQYGGWRVGIRSFDGLRYWYYAHLRQNRPYAEGLEKGKTVMAGDVIGYVGRTGYSSTENKNNIKQSHLHWGLQLVFDESQKDGNNQIWIDLYEITRLLMSHRSETIRNPETKEHVRAGLYREEVPGGHFQVSPAGPAPAVFFPEAPGAPKISETPEAPPIHKKDTREKVAVPVIMYHSILKNPAKRNTYVITPQDFEQDLQWLYKNGYHTVGVRDVIDYAENGAMLPEKPIMLTFDDGHYNNVFYAEPLLEQYGMNGVMFVVGAFCDKAVKEGDKNPNYSYIMWEDQRRMVESGLWEVESHSYDLHRIGGGARGVSKCPGESDETCRARLREDFQKLDSKVEGITGVRPLSFAYPFGHITKAAEETLRETGCKATFSCYDGLAEFRSGDPESLRVIPRRLRTPGKPVSQLAA